MATQTIIENNLWKHFTRVNNYSVKCDICHVIYTRTWARAHLYKSHNITDQGMISQWNNHNHIIFQHFSKKDLFRVECKYCGKLLKSAYIKWNLDAHLRLVHKQEIAAIREKITRSWVSPHFTFDHKYKINCMYCHYFGKIYDGVDVLKNHLKEVHDLDEHFVKRIEKELDYLEATMQYTIEESNVATSFQDGNTH